MGLSPWLCGWRGYIIEVWQTQWHSKLPPLHLLQESPFRSHSPHAMCHRQLSRYQQVRQLFNQWLPRQQLSRSFRPSNTMGWRRRLNGMPHRHRLASTFNTTRGLNSALPSTPNLGPLTTTRWSTNDRLDAALVLDPSCYHTLGGSLGNFQKIQKVLKIFKKSWGENFWNVKLVFPQKHSFNCAHMRAMISCVSAQCQGEIKKRLIDFLCASHCICARSMIRCMYE